ncbi:hypothetical protein VP01_5667g1, partial [Puccinia sorghi]
MPPTRSQSAKLALPLPPTTRPKRQTSQGDKGSQEPNRPSIQSSTVPHHPWLLPRNTLRHLHEKIKILVKEHVALKNQFNKAPAKLQTKKNLLHQVQESQKSLQKLIPNKEIKYDVNGWNPWEAKRPSNQQEPQRQEKVQHLRPHEIQKSRLM